MVFSLPLFILPITASPLMWNKHILLLVLSFLTLILWMIDIMKTGELKLNWTKLSTAILILVGVLGLSTIFSVAKTHSFWSTLSPGSYLNFIVYIIVFFLASNIFDKNREIIKTLILLLISGTIVNLLFLSQLFFNFILPWNFTQTVSFNLIGSIWTMAIFSGGLVVILISLLNNSKIFKSKYYKGLGYLALALFFVNLIIIGFRVVWVGIALAMIIIIWQKLKELAPDSEELKESEISQLTRDKTKRISLKQVYLPAVIFIVAVILIVIKVPLPEQFALPNLVTLNNESTHEVVSNSLGGSFKNIMIGSGPATFEYQYRLHQPANIIQGPFWQTRFTQGRYALATFLLEFGVLGLVAFLLILFAFLYQGLKIIISSKKQNQSEEHTGIQSTITVSGFYFLLFWFLHAADFFLLFITFLILGLWLSSINLKRKQIIFIKSPQLAFFTMLIAIVIIAVSVIGLYYSGKKYVAAITYGQALELAVEQNFDADSVINLLAKAIDLDNTNDLYLRELSEVYLIKLGQIPANQLLPPEQKQQNIQLTASQLDAMMLRMLEINPANSQNWEQAGKIYTNLMVLDLNAYQFAINNYNKARELDPSNPSVLLSLASLNFELVKNAQNQLDQAGIKEADKDQVQAVYNQSLKDTLVDLDTAIKLKNNYVPAYYLKAIIYEFSSQYDLALAHYQIVLQVEPNNQEIIDKIKAIQKLIEK